jgi:2-methylfumaryl-CoA isomerase
MFGLVDQPRIGSYLAPTTPMSFDGEHPQARPAPANGDDTAHVLAEYLGLSASQIADLDSRGVVRATSRPASRSTAKDTA